MAKKKKGNALGFVLLAIVAVGLVLAIVGMFVGQVAFTYKSGLKGETTTESFALFAEWGDRSVGGVTIKGISNVFGIIAFIVTIVGLALLLVEAIMHYLLGKEMKLIRFIGIALSLVGGILVLVAGFVMANQCYGGDDAKTLIEALGASFSAGIGVWLGFVGGLVGAVGGGLAMLKQFN